MPPGSAQPDFFYDSFCTSCQSSRCRSSCVFASAVSAPHRRRVIRALPEPSIPAAVICENSFSALTEESLYDFPLNLGFHDPAPHPMRRFCISAIGIESPTAANLSLTRTCQSPELESALDSDLPLTYTCQLSEPVPESKPNSITSRAPEHKGVVFTKFPPKLHDFSPWPEVTKIVRGLGISCEDDNFHCPMDCDTPENHIENQAKKPDNSWSPETIPTPCTKRLIKLLSTNAKLPTRGSEDAARYNLYSCEPVIIPLGTLKSVDTGISVAASSTRLYARIAPRSVLAVKGLDIGAGVVDSNYRGPIKVLLINNSDTPFQINTGDHMAQLILERIENPDCTLVEKRPSTGCESQGFGSTGINSADPGCNEPMIVQVRLNKDTSSSAIINSRASMQFIDLDFAVKNYLPLTLKPTPETLIVVDRREAENQLTHTSILELTVDQHLETSTFQVTKLAGWNMILWKTWLKRHTPVIDWGKNTVTYSSGYCQGHCLPTRSPRLNKTINLNN